MTGLSLPRSPLSWLADRVTLNPKSVRWSTFTAVLVSILIIVTGGIVRVTGSGLGCPTWPSCDADSFMPGSYMDIQGVIEFVNRALTGVVCLAVAWVLVSTRLQARPDRTLVNSAWAQIAIVLLNAVVGGVTVLTGLNPYVVAAHFLAAVLLLTTTTVSYDIAQWGRTPRSRERDGRLVVSGALTALTALLVMVGAIVTGAGPHPGDSEEVARIPVSWVAVTATHGALALAVVVFAVACARVAGQRGDQLMRRRSLTLLALLVAQGILGVYQSVAGLPGGAIVLHLLGAALIWSGTIRVLLAARTRVPTMGGAPVAGWVASRAT